MVEDSDQPSAYKTPCRLWRLPGELRNRIYRDVLLESEDATGSSAIKVTKAGYSRPGLLSVCKKIRSETLKIYYYENKFTLENRAFDSDPIYEWKKQCDLMGLEGARVRDSLGSSPGDERRPWPNLVLWLKRWHGKEIWPYIPEPEDLFREGLRNMTVHVISGLFITVKELRA